MQSRVYFCLFLKIQTVAIVCASVFRLWIVWITHLAVFRLKYAVAAPFPSVAVCVAYAISFIGVCAAVITLFALLRLNDAIAAFGWLVSAPKPTAVVGTIVYAVIADFAGSS